MRLMRINKYMILNKTFQALSDPTRQKIIELLKKKDMPAGEIATHFSITLPSLSHHLNVLKQSDLISFERQGQTLLYSLNLSVFEEVSELIIKFFRQKK